MGWALGRAVPTSAGNFYISSEVQFISNFAEEIELPPS
jgi:hypothetical protein